MASPAIVLRFRDAVPGIDTIVEHRAMLAREGAVWWGWWKKEFEEDQADYFKTWDARASVDLLILDRATKRAFCATCIKWVIGGSSGVDAVRIPDYYRQFVANVSGWFLLRSLEAYPFSEELSDELGEHTMARLDQIGTRKPPLQSSLHASTKPCILHLSDLHFGKDYNFARRSARAVGDQRKYLTDSLTTDLVRIGLSKEIGAVLVTGDFTTGGDWSDKTREEILLEFNALRSALELDKDKVLAVPGNHDIVRYPPGTSVSAADIATGTQTTYSHEREFRTFVDELAGRNWRESLNYIERLRFPEADVLLCILNSCTITATQWTEYGYVGTGVNTLRNLGQEKIERPTYKLMALHHHLLPVSHVETPESRGVTLSLDAAGLLDEAQSVGVHVALHGHQHMSRLVYYKTIPLLSGKARTGLHIVSNGSTSVVGSRRTGDERNSYCVFKFEKERLHLWMRELRSDGAEGATLFDGELEIKPIQPEL